MSICPARSLPVTPSVSCWIRLALTRRSMTRGAGNTSLGCCNLMGCASREASETGARPRLSHFCARSDRLHMTPQRRPGEATRRTARIMSLDVLRGMGVLGMLAVHIQLFAFPVLTRWNPAAYGNFTGLNWWVWLATVVLADGKFITIFAMLLGVSIV